MKKVVLIFLCAILCSVKLNATGQIAENLLWNGEEFQMMHLPIELNDSIAKEVGKRSNKNFNSALWRGYIGYWKISSDSLFLDSVIIDRSTRQKMVIDDIFSRYKTDKGYFALWVNDTICIGKGEWVYYNHMGFDRNYENEIFLYFKNGKICGKKEFHNRLALGSGSESDLNAEIKEVSKHFDWTEFPELEDVKRIVVRVTSVVEEQEPVKISIGAEICRNIAGLDEKKKQEIEAYISELCTKYLVNYPVPYINGSYKIISFYIPIIRNSE